ncbi:MAG: SH3 domain-containing protein [Ramlibacter sp.]|nr:SH3 domain-containing protein [Ramlibacter sp.]MCW5649365.1 SH3 domain-containing protein [Ramlibacter sp.]
MAVWLSLAALHAQAQTEAAVIRRTAELREAPGATSRSLAALPAQTPVTRLGGREGPWVQVRTEAGVTGWVHLFDMGAPGTAVQSGSGNAATGALRSLTSFFNKRSSAGNTSATPTVGIRGLGAEDLAHAQPNLEAVGRMEALRQSESQARHFASAATLSPVEVPPLPEPARPAAATGTPGNEVQQ